MANNQSDNLNPQSTTTKRLRVGIIFGGRSVEHEVSLVSAASVINALDTSKYEVVPIGIAPNGRWLSSTNALKLLKEKTSIENEPELLLVPDPRKQSLVPLSDSGGIPNTLDVIIPIIHGTYGEDGTLQGLLELADIPYVGAGTRFCSRNGQSNTKGIITLRKDSGGSRCVVLVRRIHRSQKKINRRNGTDASLSHVY